MTPDNRAICFSGVGLIEIRRSEIPVPGPGQVLIRTLKTLISAGTELTLLHPPAHAGGAWSGFAQFPRPVGYSNVGQVVQIGAKASPRLKGALVASRGCHAAWVVRDAADVRVVPREVRPDEATFTTLACVAMHGLRRVGLTWGESVAIFGLGIVGQLCARLAAVAGAASVYGFERWDLRRSRLPARPFVKALPADMNVALALARDETASRGVDVAIEATGAAELIPSETGFLREQGRLLLLSSPQSAVAFDFHDLCNRRSLSIIGAHGFSQTSASDSVNAWTRQRHADLFLSCLAGGRMSVGELITHHIHYQRAREAYDLLLEQPQDTLAVILNWS